MNRRAMCMMAGVLMLCGAPRATFGSQLQLGQGRGQAGRSVTLPLTYKLSGGRTAVALATDIQFDPAALSNPRCDSGNVLSRAGKSVQCAQPRPGLLRIAVFGLNSNPVPEGEVATVTFDVAPGVRPRRVVLRQTPSAADANGTEFRIGRKTGLVRLTAP